MAVICWKLLGVSKLGGVLMLIIVTPGATGSNCVLTANVFGVKTTGLVRMVPADGLEFDNATFTVSPPRTGWSAARLSVTGLSREALIWTFRFAAFSSMLKLPGVKITNPDGSTSTLENPSLYPEAWTWI